MLDIRQPEPAAAQKCQKKKQPVDARRNRERKQRVQNLPGQCDSENNRDLFHVFHRMPHFSYELAEALRLFYATWNVCARAKSPKKSA